LVKRRITSEDVIDQLFTLFIFRAVPEHIRSDNGPEFTAQAIRRWRNRLGVKTLFVEQGSPWENGYIESFNGKLRDELFNREIFYALIEAKVLIEQWRKEYNQVRPHSSLNYWPPAPPTTIATLPVKSNKLPVLNLLSRISVRVQFFQNPSLYYITPPHCQAFCGSQALPHPACCGMGPRDAISIVSRSLRRCQQPVPGVEPGSQYM